MLLNDINFDGSERKIFRGFVEEIRGRGKSETLKKVGDSTVHRTDKAEEDEEEVEGTVIGGGGDEVSGMYIVYPRWKVSVSSLGYLSSVGSSYKPSRPSLSLYLGVNHIQEYFKKKRGRK